MHRTTAAAFVTLLAAGSAHAQCTPHWLTGPGEGMPGLLGIVESMTTWDPDGAGPLPPVLVVAGAANLTGAAHPGNVAYWDESSSTWLPLGSIMSGAAFAHVYSLIAYNGDLIAGGNFDHAGGVATYGLALRHGSIAAGAWQAMGGLASTSQVDALSIYGGQLVVGGAFGSIGTVTNVGSIALWDGAAWHQMNNGFNQFVKSIAPYNGILYVGGTFSSAVNGNGLSAIGSWVSPGPWEPLGAGVGNGVPYALQVYGGELIAGGGFTTAGPIAANNIARWNGSAWGTMGAGITNGWVLAMTEYNGQLIAAGTFVTAGGATANHIASWTGTGATGTWQPLAGGVNLQVNAVTVYNGNLVAGGNFFVVDGQPRSYVAVWGCLGPQCGSADFNCDGDIGTDADIEAFFACLAGNCPAAPCTSSADFNGDGDTGTDADIESFFRVLAGGAC